MKKKNRKILRGISWICFLVYLICMVYFLFFSERMGRIPTDTYHYNLTPFAEIGRYMHYIDQIGYYNVIINLVGNVVCFVPLGLALPILMTQKNRFFPTVGICFLASVFVEILQLLTKLGTCDVDDVLMNTVGGLIGCILFYVFRGLYRIKKKK